MAKVSSRAHRFSLICAVAAVVSLGWSPSQAFAADGAVVSTVDAATDPVLDTVTNTASGLDTVTNTASGPVDTVTNTASGLVDTVTNTASGPVDTVTNTASGLVDTVTNTVGDATTAATRAVGDTQGDQLSAVTGTTSRSGSSSGAAATGRSPVLRPQSLHDDLVLLADRSQAGRAIGDEGHGYCVAAAVACQTRMDGSAGSWTRSVADIIRKLLALTGWTVLPWIVASCFLSLAGMLFLYQARDRPELGSARPS